MRSFWTSGGGNPSWFLPFGELGSTIPLIEPNLLTFRDSNFASSFSVWILNGSCFSDKSRIVLMISWEVYSSLWEFPGRGDEQIKLSFSFSFRYSNWFLRRRFS